MSDGLDKDTGPVPAGASGGEARADRCYAEDNACHDELEHRYGPDIHLLARPYLLTLLARLCAPETVQPDNNRLLTSLYRLLLAEVFGRELPVETVQQPTRMIASTPAGEYRGVVVRRTTPVVTVNIARAGTLPSHVCFELLNELLEPAHVRQDHLIMNRRTDESGQVVGADLFGSKIGGDIDQAVVIVPDPMGATGSSIQRTLDHYQAEVEGKPLKFVVVHLIVTPDYLRALRRTHPDVVVYAIRLDRGLSPPDVLDQIPGTQWARETGLDEKQYIVPGGGGFGEILNNSFV